jgi:hypothetical protein
MKRQTPLGKTRRGIVAVFVAFALTGLLGVVAISVDGGMLYLQLRKGRTTADAAAMAAACELFRNYPKHKGKDPGNDAKNAALAVAAANGYTDDGTNSTVTVNIPPKSGAYAGQDSYAEVIVTFQVQRAFSRIWGAAPIPVRARAVSRGAWVAPKAGVLILDYDDKSSLNAQGNGAFTETGGPVIINSNDPGAVVVTGNGTMIAPEFNITGGVQLGGNSTFKAVPDPSKIYLGTHPTPDPLGYLTPPTVPADGTITTTSLGGGAKQYILTPGRHTNLPTFTSGDIVILKQASANTAGGVYYIDGGGFKSTGATIIMDPTTNGGVMLYNKPQSQALSEKIQITGNPDGKVDLSPLTQGPYSGLMVWQDRSSTIDLLVEGNGDFTVRGTLYAANALLNVNGNGKTSTGTLTGFYYDDNGVRVDGASRIGSQFVVKNLSMGGNGNINILYNGPDIAPTRIITLVE